MNKTTTSLTELILNFDKAIDAIKDLDSPISKETVEACKECAISLLQKEREDMEQAYVDGITHRSEFKCKLPLDYFNQSFTQYKTTDNE